MRSSGFRLILFDYDGTLFDTRPAIIHCLRRSFEECGRPVRGGDAIAAGVRTGATLPDTLLWLDPELGCDHRALSELVVTYRRLYRDEGTTLLHAFPGTAETLRQLHRDGIKCLVVSNKGTAAIHRSLATSGLSALIDFVLGDQPGMPKKPDPAIVTAFILSRYRAHRDEILIIGDTEIDILFAKRSGVTACWASYGYGEPEQCRALEPQHVISAITELPAVIFSTDKSSHRLAL